MSRPRARRGPWAWLRRALLWLWAGRAGLLSPIGNDLGRRGEREAARFLRRAGYRVIGRNVRVRVGEADLVCECPERRAVVIVEVKTRLRVPDAPERSLAAAPEESVTARKRRKLVAVARSLARANRWEGRPVRIDVVAVEVVRDRLGREDVHVRHHAGAVRA